MTTEDGRDDNGVFPDESTTAEVNISTFNQSKNTTDRVDGQADFVWLMYQGSISEKQFEKVDFILNVVMRPTVCLFGLIGNSMGFGVLFRKEFRRSSYWYLCGITVSDTFFLLCSIVDSIPSFLKTHNAKLSEYIQAYSFPYVNAYLSLVSFQSSTWLIVAFSIERYLAVSRPLKIKDSFFHRHSFFVCLATYITMGLYHIPNTSMFEVREYFNPIFNDVSYTVGYRDWAMNSGFRVIYGLVGLVVAWYLPMVILFIMNVGIIRQTNLMQSERSKYLVSQGSRNSWREQRKLNITLVTISISFLLAVAPNAAILTLSKVDDDFTTLGREHFLFYLVLFIARLLSVINSSIDFIIYFLVSDVVRTLFRKQFGCLAKKRTSSLREERDVAENGFGRKPTQDLPMSRDVSTISHNTNQNEAQH